METLALVGSVTGIAALAASLMVWMLPTDGR